MVTCNIGQLQEFQDEIKSVLQKVKDALDTEKKSVYLEELQRLKNKFKVIDFNEPLSTVYSIRSIRKLFSKDNNLKNILFFENGQVNTYSQELSTQDPAQVESTLDLGSKFDNIDSTNTEKNELNAAKEHFLNPYFIMASGSRLWFEQDFKHELIKNLFFNSQTGRLNKNGTEIDQSIKDLRNKFEKKLDEYIRLTQPDYFQYYSRKSLEGKIEYFKEILDNGIFSINSTEILRIPVLGTIQDSIIKSKLEAYTAYISLIHFDDLIEQALGDSVKISYKGNYSTDNLKYSVNLGDRNVVSWSDESQDIDETEQIGGIIRLYMESLDLYDPKSGEKLPFKMTFNDVKSGVIGIMKFLEEVIGRNNQESDVKTRIIQEGRTGDENNIKELLKNQIGSYYNKGQEDGKGFDYIWDKYFQGKTLPQVIAATKRSPNLLAPALFAYLVADKNIKFSRYQEYQGVYSLFKNIFDYNNENSLLRKVSDSGINLDSADIYSFVTTLFVNLENIRMLEYKRDSDGSLNIINIIQNTENVRLNSLKYQLEGMYNVNIPHNFKSFTIEDFKTNKLLTIRLNNSNYELRVSINDGKPSVVFYSNGIATVPSNNDSLVLEFLSEVFNKEINSEFMDLFIQNNGNISDLLEIAGTVLYNYKLGKVIQQDIKQNPGKKAKELYDTKVKEFYTKNPPTTIRGQMQPELTNSSQYVKMLQMVKILDFLQGYSGETTAKDGQRKQISLVALSSLMSKYMEIVYNHNFSDPNSIMKKEDFSIYDFFEGVEFVRAYSGSDSKKPGTSFSENEFFAANFIYDFYGQQYADTVNGRSTNLGQSHDNPTKLRVMGPVVADKPRIPKIVVDWLSKTRIKKENGEYKKIYELTPEDILDLQEKEFGQYYKKLYQRIHQDLGSLNPFIQQLNKSQYSIVFAHPAIGKTWSVTNGILKDKIIDWDTRFNIRRDEAIAQHEGIRLEDPNFRAVREDYLINPESHEWYMDFMSQVWKEVKAEAKRDNKILVVSPHILLKKFAKDFNVIINIDEKTFIDRNIKRKANNRKNSKLWKEGIDNTIESLIKEGEINDYDVFTTDKYLEDILLDGTLDYDSDFESFNLYCKVRGLNPEELIHEAVAEQQKQARENGQDDYSVKITDNIHFVKGGDKQIHNSISLFHQLNVYNQGVKYKIRKNKDYLPNMDLSSIDETSEMSRRRINLQLISELIQGDTILKLGISNSNVSDGGKFAGEEYNKNWKKGNNIVYGRIIEGDNTIDLYSEDSFKKWKEYTKVFNLLKHAAQTTNNPELNKLIESIDEKSPKFNLGKALDVVNKYYKYAQLLSYDENSKSRKIRDDIAKTLTLPDLKVLAPIVVNFFRNNNPTWGEEAINRNVKKVLNDEKRSRQIYANYFIYSLVADTFSKRAEAIAASDILESYVTNNNIESKEFNIEINPEIERYLTLNNWIYESYMLTSAGSFIAHPGNNKATSIFNYEYGHFGQQVKRNVSQTATKHREVQDSLKGIRNKVRMAIVEDERDSYITLKGDYGARGIKVHDGATWYNGTMNQLSNNSLGADAMGQDKKPFIHFMDVTTGIGGIVKTAGFVVTNDHIQTSERHRRMNKIMNDTIKWTDTLKKYGYDESYYDWLTDFNDKSIDFGNGWYIYDSGNYYRCYNPKIDENGNTIVQVQKVHLNGEPFNETSFEMMFGYVNGDFIGIRENDGKYYTINGNQIISDIQFKPVNSNWELWKVFGGEYSAHLENGKLSYFNDNSSFINVNYIMNHTGKVINPDIPVHSQENLRQIIKESQIDMIPTMGAVKFGATNVNTVKMFTDDNYKVTYMEVFSDDLGEQLNAEHQAEGGHVSLMTQVINAIGARGYSREEAEECYEALELLALQSFETAFEGLDELNRGEVTEKLKLEIANILLNALKNVSLADGDILSAIAVGINKIQKFTTYSDIEKRFPISSPLIFNNLFSKLASSLEKAAIRLKFDGGMLVLNPSNRIFQIINGKLSGRVSRDELSQLQNEAFSYPIQHGSEIQMGHNYFIMGETKAKLVDSLDDFYYILNAVQNGYQVCEAFVEDYSIVQDKNGTHPEWNLNKPLGRDLATYDLSVLTKDGRRFSAWQFNIVRQLHNWDDKNKVFKIKQNIPQTRLEIYWNLWRQNGGEPSQELINELTKIGISEINPDKMHSYLESYLQKTLNSVGNGIGRTVLVNDEELEIESTKVSPYEAILPMIYKTTFGLEEGDSIGEIENDQYFFVKRLIKNAKSKFGSEDGRGNFIVDGSGFDLELKRTSGDHIYLAHSSRKHPRRSEVVNLETEVVGEALYRLHPETKKRMYQIPSKKDENGIIVPNCEIIKTKNGTEIIYTNDFNTILDQMEYNSIAFGDLSKIELSTLRDILLQLEQSTNSSAKAKAQYVINAVNEKALRNKKGLEEGNALYNIIAEDAQLANDFLNYTKKNSISEIFEYLDNPKDAAINALINHELYKNDATRQYKELQELENYILGKKQAVDENGNPMSFEEWYSQTAPYIKHILDFGIKQHTSFLASLEAIVSRTPAQSQQSFMAMKVAGFDINTTNSIYVNRMQLFLQGSDYDIDKANVLGVKINNGILQGWSPYFNLTTKEKEELSETLPFPSGRKLDVKAFPSSIAFDYLEKNYERIDRGDGRQAIIDNDGNGLVITETADGIFIELVGENTNNYLIEHAAFSKIEKGTKVFGNFNKEVFQVEEDGTFIGINNSEDQKWFVESYPLNTDNIKQYYNNLRIIIKTFTKIGSIIPELENTRDIVDKHNTFFLDKNGKSNKKLDRKKREALYNFVSLKVKNISKNPINLIQGQSGIDVATDSVKDLVKPGGKFDRLSTTPESSDSRTTYARMRQLVLTLTGKDDVGIVASAMKVFEAISHYYYKVLAEGTVEEQERLLSNVWVLGKNLRLIANSFVKNKDSIKSDSVLEAYENVDNTQDAFIMMSALLSLATDNTKDPTLSKLNANPNTIGCYTAGLVLGLNIEEVANLLISDTGIMLSNMTKGNVFNSDTKQFSKLTEAIRYLQYPPKYPGDAVNLTDLFVAFGLFKRTEKKKNITASDVEEIIKKKRKRIRELAGYVLGKNKELETDVRKLAEREVKNITDDSDYYGWQQRHIDRLLELSKNSKRNKKEQSEYESLQNKQKKHKELKERLEKYQKYLDNPESASKEVKEELQNMSNINKELQNQKSSLNNTVFKLDLGVKEFFRDVFDWTSRREIIENDFVEINGVKYNRFRQIRKLNSFNDEMGDLRKVLKLNQGLPNAVKDQLSWINQFSGILNRASNRSNRKPKKDNALGVFAAMNNDTLDLNLNRFLNDQAYQQAAINAYEETKIGVNILAVMANSSHYRGYMKTMNLLYEGGKAISINYKSQAWISKNVLPTMNLNTKELNEEFFKKTTPVTFNKINQMFLWQQQVTYNIPKFKITDGELKEFRDEEGNLLYESIRLGTEETNQKFKDYVVNYLYPYLLDNYSDNPFVKAIGLRSYNYNLNREVTVNLAKTQQYNMNNPTDKVKFNEVKRGLADLSEIKGIIPALFYYNLIAYNGQPGQQSLTNLFEDFVVYGTNKTINDYNAFITYLDESNINLWTEEDIPYLQQVLAPDIYSIDQLIDSNIPFAWIPNPENNKSVLIKHKNSKKNQSSNSYDEENGYNDYEGDFDPYNPFEGLAEDYGYNDNEYEEIHGHYAKYISWKDIIERGMGQYTDKFELKLSTIDKREFILGNSIIDSELFNTLVQKDYPDKKLSELTKKEKLNLLRNNKDNIKIRINGSDLTLSDIIDIAKNNGWTKEAVYDSFQFYKRKSRTETYDYFDIDTLKSRLDTIINQNKEQDCNG